MNAWAYVAAGWIGTGAVIATYWIWVARRTRRAAVLLARVEDQA